jgi:hypothetical protein
MRASNYTQFSPGLTFIEGADARVTISTLANNRA